jgi:hypothetical protein
LDDDRIPLEDLDQFPEKSTLPLLIVAVSEIGPLRTLHRKSGDRLLKRTLVVADETGRCEHVDPMAAVQAIPVRGLQGAERARFTAQANEYKARFGLLDTQMVARFE